MGVVECNLGHIEKLNITLYTTKCLKWKHAERIKTENKFLQISLDRLELYDTRDTSHLIVQVVNTS